MGKFHRSVWASGAALGLLVLGGCGGGGDAPKQANKNTTTAPAGGNAQGGGAAQAQAPAPDDTTTMTGATLAQFTGNPQAGQAVFAQCRACHVTDPGVNRIGPSLHGIVGRQAGTVPGYQYSPANANSGITWTPEKLFQYLENPQRVVPGTKMAFAGIRDPQQRADLIAWLGTQGGNGAGAAPAAGGNTTTK